MIYKQSVFDEWPIESESVQAVITSPPYYALRKYSIPDVIIGAWKGQYGLEPTPQMYIEHTRLWAKEAWRVLRNDGIFFLNLGDSYGGSGGDHKEHHKNNSGFQGNNGHLKGGIGNRNKPKCQLLIPHRVAIALVDDSWILRNTIVWNKPNAMPESVTDRFSKKYEYVFMFVKSDKYYFDLDSVREPHKEVSLQRVKRKWNGHKEQMSSYANMDISKMCHVNGKNPGDVWSIQTQPSSEKHYAMWPERLVERMIKCSTKAGDMVLDPFAGSATTLKVAKALGRIGIGIDLGYHDISDRRLSVIQKRFI